jgi:hypothetical protein
MANTTASASGTNRKRHAERKNIGTNTMQMHSVAEGRHADLAGADEMASCSGLPRCRWRSMFSMVTMASSTRMPTASARPPRVMRLMVSPSAASIRMAAMMDSGMVSR